MSKILTASLHFCDLWFFCILHVGDFENPNNYVEKDNEQMLPDRCA